MVRQVEMRTVRLCTLKNTCELYGVFTEHNRSLQEMSIQVMTAVTTLNDLFVEMQRYCCEGKYQGCHTNVIQLIAVYCQISFLYLCNFQIFMSSLYIYIPVTHVFETTLADHNWTDGGVKSDASTPIQGSSSVMNDFLRMIFSEIYKLINDNHSSLMRTPGLGSKRLI